MSDPIEKAMFNALKMNSTTTILQEGRPLRKAVPPQNQVDPAEEFDVLILQKAEEVNSNFVAWNKAKSNNLPEDEEALAQLISDYLEDEEWHSSN